MSEQNPYILSDLPVIDFSDGETLKVEMHPVENDNIAFVGWSAGNLYVEFRSAPKILYKYIGVPKTNGSGDIESGQREFRIS
jgi:hypothetical protein